MMTGLETVMETNCDVQNPAFQQNISNLMWCSSTFLSIQKKIHMSQTYLANVMCVPVSTVLSCVQGTEAYT